MSERKSLVVVTYHGLDGACAAATVLLRHPAAALEVSSAARIGRTLAELGGAKRPPAEIHVCGVGAGLGAAGIREETIRAAQALRRRGAALFWHCGRGYLDAERDWLAAVCTPVFRDLGSNTEALRRHLDLEADPRAEFLARLALHDSHLAGRAGEPGNEERRWLDLVSGAGLLYFKYDDRESYPAAIRKLARREFGPAEERAVEIHRRSGDRYILHGHSEAIRELRREIGLCAAADEPVLITGETGTGKEHVAHLVHDGSRRATEPLVPVNCAQFSGSLDLVNSALFGHRRGAFTGAVEPREGKFAAADGGILFLDEIGELPLEIQAKLLRVLQDGWIEPVGADKPEKQVDVRIIAATNRDLPSMIRRGRFREDLYHRLDILRLHVPPLRERPEDIEVLARRTLDLLRDTGQASPPRPESKGGVAKGETPAGFSPPRGRGKGPSLRPTDVRALRAYDWPGNVRQLIKVLKRAVHLCLPLARLVEEERRLGPLAVGIGGVGSTERGPGAMPAREARGGRVEEAPAGPKGGEEIYPRSAREIQPIAEVRRRYASRARELLGGNHAAAARALGVSVNTLKAWLRDTTQGPRP